MGLLWLLVAMVMLQALQGCGWRLRGSMSMDLAVPPVYLDVRSASSELKRDLTNALKSSGVELVGNRAEAQLRLIIHNETRGRRVMSVGSSGKVSEYELQYQINFSVTDQEDNVVMQDVITQHRDYEFDDTQVLAKGDEEKRLFDFMRRTAVQSLLRRLQTLAEVKTEIDPITPESQEIQDAN